MLIIHRNRDFIIKLNKHDVAYKQARSDFYNGFKNMLLVKLWQKIQTNYRALDFKGLEITRASALVTNDESLKGYYKNKYDEYVFESHLWEKYETLVKNSLIGDTDLNLKGINKNSMETNLINPTLTSANVEFESKKKFFNIIEAEVNIVISGKWREELAMYLTNYIRSRLTSYITLGDSADYDLLLFIFGCISPEYELDAFDCVDIVENCKCYLNSDIKKIKIFTGTLDTTDIGFMNGFLTIHCLLEAIEKEILMSLDFPFFNKA